MKPNMRAMMRLIRKNEKVIPHPRPMYGEAPALNPLFLQRSIK